MTVILVESALRSLLLGLVAWYGLRLCRVRNPQAEATVWITVLAVALVMPLLLRWPVLHLSIGPAILPAAFTALALPHVDAPAVAAASAAPAAAVGGLPTAALLLPGLYLAGCGMLLLRLLVGVFGTWQILRRAQPIRGAWTQGLDVRMTEEVDTPVSFGCVVLLPMAWLDWPLDKRRAVISHERAHIENHDFIVLMFARLHAVLFWFSPFAWWLQRRLAYLAERTSDEAATAALGSRIDYAEILLDIAVGAGGPPGGIALDGLAMARPVLLHRRVESLLSQSATGFTLSLRRRLVLVAALLPSVLVIAGTAWHARAADLALPGRAAEAGHSAASRTPDFVLLRRGSIRTNAGTGATERMMSAYGGGVDALLFEHAGGIYAVTDPALLDRADALLGSAAESVRQRADLARQRADLARRQADFGRQQGDLGRQQGNVGRQMGELAREHARDGSSDADFQKAMAALQQQMDDLSKGHERLSVEEAKLALQEEELRSPPAAGHGDDEALQALIDRALADGMAARIGRR